MSSLVDARERPSTRERLSSVAGSAADSGLAVWLIVLVVAVLSTWQSDAFLTQRNFSNLLNQFVGLGLATIGQTFVILAGSIDLSVGSMAKLSAVLSGGLIDGQGARVVPVLGLVMALGASVGFANGWLITRLKISPLIVTLGMFSVLRGLAFAYTTVPVGSMSPGVTRFLYFEIWFVPLPFVVLALLAVASSFVLRRSVVGHHVYAVGGDPQVARIAGIRTNRVTLAVMTLCSTFAALAGFFQAARSGVGTPTAGDGLELLTITAVVLGGASLFGGRGRLIGALGGAVLLAIIDNSLNLTGVPAIYKDLVRGVVIVAAVGIFMRKD